MHARSFGTCKNRAMSSPPRMTSPRQKSRRHSKRRNVLGSARVPWEGGVIIGYCMAAVVVVVVVVVVVEVVCHTFDTRIGSVGE